MFEILGDISEKTHNGKPRTDDEHVDYFFENIEGHNILYRKENQKFYKLLKNTKNNFLPIIYNELKKIFQLKYLSLIYFIYDKKYYIGYKLEHNKYDDMKEYDKIFINQMRKIIIFRYIINSCISNYKKIYFDRLNNLLIPFGEMNKSERKKETLPKTIINKYFKEITIKEFIVKEMFFLLDVNGFINKCEKIIKNIDKNSVYLLNGIREKIEIVT